MIKMRQSLENDMIGDKKHLRKQWKQEIENYIQSAYESDARDKLQDVYVTSHEPKTKRYHTLNEQDDHQFYQYKKSLEEYNKVEEVPKPVAKK